VPAAFGRADPVGESVGSTSGDQVQRRPGSVARIFPLERRRAQGSRSLTRTARRTLGKEGTIVPAMKEHRRSPIVLSGSLTEGIVITCRSANFAYLRAAPFLHSLVEFLSTVYFDIIEALSRSAIL
jgi:hypothetical protein